MYIASDIKNINFSTTRRGCNPDEVEAFLDKIQSDYVQYENVINNYKSKIADLEEQIANFKSNQDNIQNVLISAQRLADQIINEAREKSEEIVLKAEANIDAITNKERELAALFEAKANDRKLSLQKELDDMIAKAELKSKSITDAAADAVSRQQTLFEKIKLEIAAFKSSVTSKYKEHLNILQSLPDTVEMDPQKLADILSAKIDELPNIDSFMPTATSTTYVDVDELDSDIPDTGFFISETEQQETE